MFDLRSLVLEGFYSDFLSRSQIHWKDRLGVCGVWRKAHLRPKERFELPQDLERLGEEIKRMPLDYDAIVIGSGAGGGPIAWKLTQAGKKVGNREFQQSSCRAKTRG